MLHRSTGTLVGVDFGAPRRAADQRRKIIAVEAQPVGWRQYRIVPTGLNARLVAGAGAPGWSAAELLADLVRNPVRVVAFDFPFGVPEALLRNVALAIGEPETLQSWRSFSYACERRLKLTDPLDFGPFAGWRNPVYQCAKRATPTAPPVPNRRSRTSSRRCSR